MCNNIAGRSPAIILDLSHPAEDLNQPGKGKEQMRKGYAFLNTAGKRHCNLINRIVQGNIVIDHEEILSDRGKFYGVAIYEIKNGKIQKVWFPK